MIERLRPDNSRSNVNRPLNGEVEVNGLRSLSDLELMQMIGRTYERAPATWEALLREKRRRGLERMAA